jgi:hypothetical protein
MQCYTLKAIKKSIQKKEKQKELKQKNPKSVSNQLSIKIIQFKIEIREKKQKRK